jgi:hypothetical protein
MAVHKPSLLETLVQLENSLALLRGATWADGDKQRAIVEAIDR